MAGSAARTEHPNRSPLPNAFKFRGTGNGSQTGSPVASLTGQCAAGAARNRNGSVSLTFHPLAVFT
jgi:hypothetical protein